MALRDVIDCYLNIGFNYMAQGNFDKAIETFDKVIELDPNNPEGYRHCGYAYREKARQAQGHVASDDRGKDDFDKSNKAFEKAIELYQNDS